MRMTIRMFVALGAVLAGGVDAQNTEIIATVRDAQGVPLAEAVVVAFPADGNLRPAPKPRDAAIFQVDKEFVPKVTPVLVGTAVAFPNSDTVRHHVYSFSLAKKFELPLYQGVPANPVTFDKPGVVVLGCNIHDWMVAYVYVSESPYFAKTGPDGKATISDLAPRAYTVRAWHPQLEGDEEQTRKSVDLSKAPRSEIAWSLKLKPEVRVRRAPASRQSGSY